MYRWRTIRVPAIARRASILLAAVVLVSGCLYVARHGFVLPRLGTAHASELERRAQEVIATCSQDSYPPRCYDTEIPKLMDRGLSMEDAFEVTKLVQEAAGNYFYCHVLGHNLSAKETAKDVSKWTEVVARCPIGMCGNGCLHGAAQERFRAESLTDEQIAEVMPQLAQTCESGRHFTNHERSSCYHSMGHLSMYITDADIEQSTAICDVIAKKQDGRDHTQTCYEGAYMQIFQPLEPEDFALIETIAPETQDEAEAFCSRFDGARRSACSRESWPLYRDSLSASDGLAHFCSLVPDPIAEHKCYNAMFFVLTAQFEFDEARIIPLCDGLPERRMAQCFANAASRMIETDHRLIARAAALCRIAEERGAGPRCYEELLYYSNFSFHQGSETFTQLCEAMPDPWRTKCVRGEGADARPSAYDFE